MKEANEYSRRDFLSLTAKTAAAVAASGMLTGYTLASALPGATKKGPRITGDFDIILSSGLVCDGTKADPYRADIGIRGDRIAAVGDIGGKAGKVIDAANLMVAPGFIDVHTHCDLTFKDTGMKRFLAYVMPSWKGNYNYIYQGVTTVVTGNCGYGYTDTDYWMGLVDYVGFGTNVYHLAPHGAIRDQLFGKEKKTVLGPGELDIMKAKVYEEMQKGAIGLSTGLAYAPGCFTGTGEIIELAKVAGRQGGVYASHIRDERGKLLPDGTPAVIASIREAIEIGKMAEIPVQISHLKIEAPVNDLKVFRILEPIETARAEGLSVHVDQYPYNASSTRISIFLPPDMVTSTSIQDAYRNPEGKKSIKEAIEQVFAYLPPEKILIGMFPQNTSYEGKTILEIAKDEGKSPSECYVDLVSADPCPFSIYFGQDENVVREIMNHEYVITASDGWTVPKGMTRPHPRTYGTFPRKLREFALKEKIIPLKDAIISMTSLPAQKFNLKGRGMIAEGNYADIALLNLETITDHATYLDPHQYAEGVTHLLVNGVLAIENGKATGNRGGKALRRG